MLDVSVTPLGSLSLTFIVYEPNLSRAFLQSGMHYLILTLDKQLSFITAKESTPS